MATCWVTRGPWGQLQELPEDTEPDIVLEGLGELPELLDAWHAGALDADVEAAAAADAKDEA